MSPSDLNRKLHALELTDPQAAANLEELSVAATLFSHFSGDPDEVVLATRAAALGQSGSGVLPNSAAVAAAQAYVNGRQSSGFERQAEEICAVLFPIEFKSRGG